MHVWRNVKLFNVENILVHSRHVLVRECHERAKTSFKKECLRRRFRSLIADVLCTFELKLFHLLVVEITRINNGNAERLHKVRLLTKAVHDCLPIVFNLRENSWVGLECDGGPLEV